MFTFKQKVKKSFVQAKEEISQLKKNISEWLFFLNAKQYELEGRIRILEEKLQKLEYEGKLT